MFKIANGWGPFGLFKSDTPVFNAQAGMMHLPVCGKIS